MSYRNLAFERWPKAPEIHGVGRYALINEHTGEIFLYLTLAEALASAQFHNCRPIDLQPTPIPEHCRDIYDREEARREAREQSKK